MVLLVCLERRPNYWQCPPLLCCYPWPDNNKQVVGQPNQTNPFRMTPAGINHHKYMRACHDFKSLKMKYLSPLHLLSPCIWLSHRVKNMIYHVYLTQVN